MPILFVHGVNTRSRAQFFEIEPLLRRYVAPVISQDHEHVSITDYYWGGFGMSLAWNGISRPRTRVLGQGPEIVADFMERGIVADEYRASIGHIPQLNVPQTSSRLISPGRARNQAHVANADLSKQAPGELSDFVAALIAKAYNEGRADSDDARGGEKARLLLAADDIVNDPRFLQTLVGKTTDEQIQLLLQRVREEAGKNRPLRGMGFPSSFWLTLTDRFREALSRSEDMPAYLASALAAELRPALNARFSDFLGDVFVYLHKRDDPASRPGDILKGLLAALETAQKLKEDCNGEPLVVLTHSMGGQLLWDAVTWLLPERSEVTKIKVDFWCAAASQVGFFEEAKLFAASKPNYCAGTPVPFPSDHLGAWWNVWDSNDFLSFTCRAICAGVDDGEFDSGSSLLAAHSGYFERPSFFREMARKVTNAKDKGSKTK